MTTPAILLLAGLMAGPAQPPANLPSPDLAAPRLTAPASIGKPHVCEENRYPIPALQMGAEGTTLMHFTIAPDGSVSDVSVQHSSGNADLDQASMSCASGWRYRPALQNGVPVAARWLAQVKWEISLSPEFLAIDQASYRCLAADKTARDALLNTMPHAVVRIHFADGKFGSVALAGSSGNADLDRKVVACYSNLPPELAADVAGETDELFVAMVRPDR